jgi:SAM-dependent methyltransferase
LAALSRYDARMDEQTVNYYQANAASVALRYESVESPVAHLFPLAFSNNARVLDIGCGSGRDLAALTAQGYDAYGLEPSAGLRQAAVASHPEVSNRIADAALPHLGMPFGGAFDCVLCSAVLMHVPNTELFDAALSIRALINQHGRLLISLPLSRGDTLQENRDVNGRLFSPYAPEEITLLFERLGFQLIGRWDTGDALARAGTSWFTLLLELRNAGVLRPIDQIETILNRDRKEATYKLALFRALAEIATQETRRAVWLGNGEVGIPNIRVAELWLQYFWPIFAADEVIPQSQAEGAGGKPVKFRAALTALISTFANQGEHGGLSSWQLAWNSNRLEPQTQIHLKTALKTIAATVRDGPVTFSGGALETGTVFRYDAKAGLIVMQAELWRELSLLGHWITDAVIIRWAALTQKFAYRQGVTAGDVLPLLLARAQPQRATALARQAYQTAGVTLCTWSNKRLRQDFAVDHVIPFALWGNNDLWNLVPTNPKTNGSKSDKLPSSDLLQIRRPQLLENWEYLRCELTGPFNLQAQHLLGQPLATYGSWKDHLFSALRQSIEMTAIQRGVERWAPNNVT